MVRTTNLGFNKEFIHRRNGKGFRTCLHTLWLGCEMRLHSQGRYLGHSQGWRWPTSVSLGITFTLLLKSQTQADVLLQYCNCPGKTCQPWLILATLLIPLEPFTPSGRVAGMGIDRASQQAALGHPCPLVHAPDQPITEGRFSICNAIMSISRHSGFLSSIISSNQEKCPTSCSSKLTPFPPRYSINLLHCGNPLTELLIATN